MRLPAFGCRNTSCGGIEIAFRDINPPPVHAAFLGHNTGCATADKGVEHRLITNGSKTVIDKFGRERGRVRGFYLLADAPDTALYMPAVRQHEIGFGDQIEHFVIWQEIARVEIDTAGPVSDVDLAYRKAGHYILPAPATGPPGPARCGCRKSRRPDATAA